jgi:hypothetical protein
MKTAHAQLAVANPPKTKIVVKQSTSIAKQRVLEKKLHTVLRSNKQTAKVMLTVRKFYGLTNMRHALQTTKCRVKLQGTNARVKQPHGPRVEGILEVSGAGALNFQFTISPGITKATYYPLGIGFRLKKKGINKQQALIARRNFASPEMHIYGPNLYFTDNYTPSSDGDLFEYYVIIQRAEDGRVGVIDPGIWHTNPPTVAPAED